MKLMLAFGDGGLPEKYRDTIPEGIVEKELPPIVQIATKPS